MPASRTQGTPVRTDPFPLPSPPQKRQVSVLDTISLTSSDDDTSKPQSRSSKKPRVEKRKARPRSHKPSVVIPAGEIIEISSDEDEGTSQPRKQGEPSNIAVIADYRRQLSSLREENVKGKREFERASKTLDALREENKQLKALKTPTADKIVLDVAQVSDNLDCEICTCRMWTPQILPNCGHSFCQSCLQDWFGAIHAQFLQAHPEQMNPNPHLLEIVRQLSQQPHLANTAYVRTLIANLMPPTPTYTCPTCRVPVTSRPIEPFALKSLIHTIATAAGEIVPTKPVPSNKKGKAVSNTSSPWDGFFPRPV